MQKHKPLVLVILDGWGYRKETAYNAIAAAHTPQWDEWWETQPHILLDASGPFVGLPNAQMGNSEVGHMHIGSGRVIHQDFTRINQAIVSGQFAKNPTLVKLIKETKVHNKTLHVMGLLSPGGIHSHEQHLFAILDLGHQLKLTNICLHLFLDGRDSPPQSALHSIAALKHQLTKYANVTLCSISGRYFAMDRDQRWERTALVYQLLTEMKSPYHFPDAETAIKTFYQQGIFDEFIPPTILGEGCSIEDNDSILFFNFRADRARQLTRSFIEKTFDAFPRARQPRLRQFVSMTQYAEHFEVPAAFPPIPLHNTFGEVIANHGLHQLRIAETEKYAHVTFFFNGGLEQPLAHEERILIPSPSVATYDLQPEMSARLLTQVLIDAIHQDQYDVIICNYANADMVGHTGNMSATVQAIECLDQCLHQLGQALKSVDGTLLITADHGNAEAMFDEEIHQPHTAHTCESVPLVYVGKGWQFNQSHGSLIDIAPTLLALLNLPQPAEMTGKALLTKQS